ncbi:MAG: response regulator [Elusimicrobiota bacterium]
MRILSTEDDPLIRAMLGEVLSSEGHDVEFARNSDEFFRLVGEKSFDLLILDVNISGLNGYQIAREISSRLGERRPKMLIFTGRDTHTEKGLIELSGVDAVLEKGCPTGKVLEAVNRLMAPPSPETAHAATASAQKSATPAEAAAGVRRHEFERLAGRVSAAVSENASLSQRLELLGKRVGKLETTVQKLHSENPSARLLQLSFALLGLAFAALLILVFLTR